MLVAAYQHQTAASHSYHDMRMTMALQAGVASRLEFKVPEMKRYPLAALANQHLARSTGKFAHTTGRNLIWLNLGVFPTKIPLKPPDRRRLAVCLCRSQDGLAAWRPLFVSAAIRQTSPPL